MVNFQNRKSIKPPFSINVDGKTGMSTYIYLLDDKQHKFLNKIINLDARDIKILCIDTVMYDRLLKIISENEYFDSDLSLLNIIRERYIEKYKN